MKYKRTFEIKSKTASTKGHECCKKSTLGNPAVRRGLATREKHQISEAKILALQSRLT
jgi:hypothetical protein